MKIRQYLGCMVALVVLFGIDIRGKAIHPFIDAYGAGEGFDITMQESYPEGLGTSSFSNHYWVKSSQCPLDKGGIADCDFYQCGEEMDDVVANFIKGIKVSGADETVGTGCHIRGGGARITKLHQCGDKGCTYNSKEAKTFCEYFTKETKGEGEGVCDSGHPVDFWIKFKKGDDVCWVEVRPDHF